MTAAMVFAMSCNCSNIQLHAVHSPNKDTPTDRPIRDNIEPCGKCRSCKKIISKNHPDIHVIKPTGDILKVEQIRALCQKLVLKPYEAIIRLAIIADAHKLNSEAGNTLLKTLEEPPDRTIFILTTLQASDLLPTIASRCQHIRFNPITRHSIQAYIENKYDLDPTTAAAVSSLAGGSVTRAETIVSTNWIDKRKWIIDEMEALPSRSLSLRLSFSEALSKNKNRLSLSFEVMKNWLRDLLVYKYSPENIINTDLLNKIEVASKQTSENTLISKLKSIEKAERDIKANANLRLTLDALIIMLSKG